MNANRIPPRGWALVALALGLGSAGGFLAGRHGPGAADHSTDHRPVSSNPGGPFDRSSVGAAAAAPNQTGAHPGGAGSKVIPFGAGTAGTLRNILAIPDTLERLATMKDWCRSLPPEEIVAIMKEFKQMMDAQERVGEMETLGLLLQSVDVVAQAMLDRGAGEMLGTLLAPQAEGEDAELREGLGGEVFKKWAEKDLAGARAFLEKRLGDPASAGGANQELSKDLMRSWVKSDPDAAMAWLLRQPAKISEAAISPAFQALSHHDPEKALKLVVEQAELPGRDDIAATIAQWWAKTTPDKALEWAQGLPEKLAGPSVKKTMETWAGQDFPAAKQAMEELSPPLREAALPVLIDHWENGKWGEAAAYLDQQAPGKGRQEAMGALIRHWAEGDQQAASGWLARQSAGPDRDAGASALAEEVRNSDPEAAAIWGATLGDEARRRDSLRETLQQWYKKSVPEALRWVETAGNLTDRDRVALLGTVTEK